jgi:hypothetical protein
MDRQYDIFEKLPDGSLVWRTFVPGLDKALATLEKFSKASPNEFFAIHTPTKETVGRVNVPSAEPGSEPRALG